MNKLLASSMVITGLLGAAFTASAHSEGDLTVRLGASTLAPKHMLSTGSTLHTTVDTWTQGRGMSVDNNTQPSVGLMYMFYKHFGLELNLNKPYNQHINNVGGAGALDGARMLTADLFLPTLNLQWYPMDCADRFQPYLGAGVAYAHYSGIKVLQDWLTAQGGAASNYTSGVGYIRNHTGWDVEAGLDVRVKANWAVNVSARYAHISSEVDVYSQPKGTSVRSDVKVNPMLYNIGVAYTF